MNDLLRQAIAKQFIDNWTGNNVCFGKNHSYRPPLTESWVNVHSVIASAQNAEVGTGMQRNEGEIIVECYVPINTGDKAISLMEDEVKNIFQNKNFDGVNCSASTIIKIGPNANWYQHNVSTVFQYDVFS